MGDRRDEVLRFVTGAVRAIDPAAAVNVYGRGRLWDRRRTRSVPFLGVELYNPDWQRWDDGGHAVPEERERLRPWYVEVNVVGEEVRLHRRMYLLRGSHTTIQLADPLAWEKLGEALRRLCRVPEPGER